MARLSILTEEQRDIGAKMMARKIVNDSKPSFGERLKEYDRAYHVWLLEVGTGVKSQTAHVLCPIHVK